MTNDAQTVYQGADLLRAAAAATEQAPHLADEIRTQAGIVAKRVSGGERISAVDLDVRTLVGLIQQAGVQVPVAHPRTPA